ncbi:MAG: FprA family A-type flavoprotein [Lachnospiraceae bacterium]|nr:FprA family A-type flavoprotein [Lachnospiraceae bacterium]
MVITEDIKYIGVNDHQIDLFEGQYIVPNGMAYNSYVILDDKVTVMDTVDVHFTEEWLGNVADTLGDRKPDYLVVQHVEPDHSASIEAFIKKYPEAIVVANQKAFELIYNFYKLEFGDNKLVVKNGDTLSTGAHTLNFIFAPFVHWPEVMFTYDEKDKVLFSADAFGKFGALDVDEEWDCEARRYYIGIVGKYGMQVQNVLKKAAELDIQTICALHGPVLKAPLDHYLEQYNTWSSYGVESEGVMIAYTSVYGHTKAAAELLAEELTKNGCPKVAINDLAREDMAECVEDAFRYGKIVLATTTYNAGIFPFMREFINHLTERNFQNKTIGLIENGSWGPMAAKVMKDMLANCKNITWTENNVRILSAVNDENIEQIKALAKELI